MSPSEDLPRPGHIQELRLLLKVLMVFRVATVTVLLGAAVLIQLKGSQVLFYAPLFTIYLLVISVYLLTILFSALFNQVEDLPGFAVFQVGADLLLYTLIVFFTGGYSSPFPFLFLFSILWSALALKGGGYWTASVSTILFGLVVDLQYFGILTPPWLVEPVDIRMANPWDILGRVFLHVVAFFAVAFLGHQIGQRYRHTSEELTERTEDLEKLRTLSDVVFESITSGIAVLDGYGKVRSMNTSARRMLSLDENPSQGHRSSRVFKGLPIQSLLERAPKGGLHRWEGHFSDETGKERTLGLSISPLQEPEKGHVVIFQDLTDLRDLETRLRTSEKLSAIGRMAASMAHELRNPLASMSGSIQILKEGLALRDENLHLMNIVLKETERLNDLVSNFLDYARPPDPKFKDVDLRDVIEETIQLLEPSVAGTGIALVARLPEERAILSVDVSQVRQILMNLVRNSVEALGRSGTVEISLRKETAPGEEKTVLSVSDDGDGIPEDILPEIFEPFRTTKEKGTGLGLAIVYQLVQIHKGTIDVRSKAGEGTTFTIRLAPWRTT